MLVVGDRVPEFKLASDSAGVVNSAALLGQRYVLYFYPKDDTSGCTQEACGFRDSLPDFSSLSVPVYGVSGDSIAAHQRFVKKYGLNFPLLADPERLLLEPLGVWVEKSMYGRKYMGIQRATFVIAPDGRIEHVWPKVKAAGHAQEVLTWLKAH